MSEQLVEWEEFVGDFADHQLVGEGYSPAQIAYTEAMLTLYRSLRVLQLMDESGHFQWDGMDREDVGAFVDVTAQMLGFVPGEREADEAVKRFIEFRTGSLAGMRYGDYLQTPEWKDVRRFALQQAGDRCQLCNRGGGLHVHHRDYVRRGHERLEDVTVLCGPCHGAFHRERGMPWREK